MRRRQTRLVLNEPMIAARLREGRRAGRSLIGRAGQGSGGDVAELLAAVQQSAPAVL